MSKTPEEMAEEHVAHNRSYPYDSLNAQDRYMKNSYLVGYKAGCENTQTQLAVGEKIVKELLGKTQWISVKDRLPEFNAPVLLWTGHEYEIGRLEEDGEFSVWADYRYGAEMDADQFTYWQPLPEPPKEEK